MITFSSQMIGDMLGAALEPDADALAKDGRYDHIDFTPPESVREAYRDGLRRHENGETGSGIESQTVRMARLLAEGKPVSLEWARKAYRYWTRSARYLDQDPGTPGYASAKLWGGRPGMSWYNKLRRQMTAADDQKGAK